VLETAKPKREHTEWTYRLSLDPVEPDEKFPIVLGDFLFNVRSALDHLVIAIAPSNRKSKASFPIFTKDPLAVDETSGLHLDTDAARRWRSWTEGLPRECIAAIQALQPHKVARDLTKPVKDQPLALLSALHNADKHRNLVGVGTGLRHAEIAIGACSFSHVPVLKNGALIYTSRTQVQVQIEGSAVIGIGGPNEPRDFQEVAGAILGFVTIEVLPRLEQFLR
jgi:hypothetical protein